MNRQKGIQIGQLPAGETALLPSEPETHTVSRHWRECMFCEDYSLSQVELQKFASLKEEANVLFEQQPRWELLRSLHAEYFMQGEGGAVTGKEWLRLGFQGNHPETDLRGGGILALQLILRFVKRKKALVQQMERDSGGFFFAITAINVAFLMKKYFHLAEGKGLDPQELCDRRALKNFCRLLVDREEAYLDLHETFLSHFYSGIWVAAEGRNTPTLLQFNELFGKLTSQMQTAFESGELLDYSDFEERWSKVIT